MIKKAFGDDALGQTQTYDWFNRFKNGRTSVDDDERSGRPSTGTTPEDVAKVREVIREDRRRLQHCETVTRNMPAHFGSHTEHVSTFCRTN